MSHYNYIIWFTCFLCISYSEDYSWSWMVWACDGLEQGLASQPEIETEFWWWKHQILATRLVVSDKGPAPSALQNRISTKMESSEANKVFIKREKSTVCIDRHTGRLRGTVPELCPCGGLNHLHEAFLPVFLWPVTLICLVHSPYLVYLRILPCVHARLLAKMDPTAKAYG